MTIPNTAPITDCNGNSIPPSAWKEYRLSAPGIRATFIPYGARLTSLQVPDRAGKWTEVNVGYADPSSYIKEAGPSYFGAVVGRVANRIRSGKFELNGKEYAITPNENGGYNTLHGGKIGYDAREWEVAQASESSVTFTLRDEGGEAWDGFPGCVDVSAAYELSDGELRATLRAVPRDGATPILLTTHGYYNLAGEGSIMGDELQLPRASRFVRGDKHLVPTGELPPTAGHALDFTAPKPIGEGRAKECGAGNEGIDNCFVFSEVSPEPQLIWHSKTSGIRLQLCTDQDAVQMYACAAKGDTVLGERGAECLAVEPQGVIDSVNHPEWGFKVVYEKGEEYVNTTTWKFDVVE